MSKSATNRIFANLSRPAAATDHDAYNRISIYLASIYLYLLKKMLYN
jgi:hypothetical protein